MSEAINASVPVMLVDDHAIWRGGVLSMLEDTEFEVIGEAGSGQEAVELARQIQPSLTLLDIRMADGDGLEALAALKQEHPRMAVIMLTTYDNPTYMARAVAGGAAGYLLKGVERDDLLSALRAVANGETLLSAQELVRSLRGISEAAVGSEDLVEPLTDREQEVLRLLTTGLPNREIASILFVAESTVKTHVEHILGKLGVSDRVQAAVWAVRHGLGPAISPVPHPGK
jgi:DNA-binding NarL/FixJ family response regulator